MSQHEAAGARLGVSNRKYRGDGPEDVVALDPGGDRGLQGHIPSLPQGRVAGGQPLQAHQAVNVRQVGSGHAAVIAAELV